MSKTTRELVDFLSEKTVSELAEFFRGEGIKGYKRNTFACPIAKYLERETGLSHRVSSGSIRIECDVSLVDIEEDVVNLPIRLWLFIDWFDQGKFPYLIENNRHSFLTTSD